MFAINGALRGAGDTLIPMFITPVIIVVCPYPGLMGTCAQHGHQWKYGGVHPLLVPGNVTFLSLLHDREVEN